MKISPKDYVFTAEGLFFAVVSDYIDCGRVLSYLRYKKVANVLQKVEN